MRKLYPNLISGWGAMALLLVRLVMGTAFILHGWPKIQNPFAWMNAMGMPGVPSFLQALAALAEFGGGIALVLGLLTLRLCFKNQISSIICLSRSADNSAEV